jgi:hypothetical protein
MKGEVGVSGLMHCRWWEGGATWLFNNRQPATLDVVPQRRPSHKINVDTK